MAAPPAVTRGERPVAHRPGAVPPVLPPASH